MALFRQVARPRFSRARATVFPKRRGASHEPDMPYTDPSWPTGRYARFTRLWKFCPGLGQGLALPISIMPADFTATLTIGLDVTATLHVKKYELPVKDTGTGKCDQKCEYINLIRLKARHSA